MERIKGIILILSCEKHKDTRLNEFGPKKNIYNGYKVIKEELIEQDSVPRAIKIFTLRKNKEIKMCSTIILSNGSLISRGCKTP